MKYNIFDDMADGILVKKEQESEQDFMERVLRAVTTKKELSDKKIINDLMEGELVSCSQEDMMLALKYHVDEWALNPNGTLHGGILSTACDMTMGVLARFSVGGIRTVTVELQMNFMRSIGPGEDYVVEARIKKAGRRMIFTECKVYACKDWKTMADASGIFTTV